MGTVIKDRDRGMARLVAQLRRGGARVKVGIPSDSSRDEGGPSNLQVGIWNEFGTSDGHVPERSFIRATYDERRAQIDAAMRKLGSLSVRKGANHRALLAAYGTWLVGLIRKRIADHIPPPNADSTIARKGSTTPLVHSGQLRKAITSQVIK